MNVKRIWPLALTGVLLSFSGTSVSKAGWADGLAIPDEAAFFDALDLTRDDLTDVRESVAKKDWQSAKQAWGEYLEAYVLPRWIWSHRDRDKMVSYLNERDAWGDAREAADRVLRRELYSAKLEHDIDWANREHGYYHVINRHGFLPHLGQAWMATHDSKYAEDWAYLVRDWIEDSPFSQDDSHGPWHRLCVNSRVSQWWNSMNMFVGADVFNAELRYQMTRSLIEHGRAHHRNPRLVKYFRRNNIHLGMAASLAVMSIMLPEAKESEAWQELAFAKLGRQMHEGVYPDGAYTELTPGYHYWVMHDFLKIMRLAKKNGVEAGDLFVRHEKMYEFLMHISTPTRGYPRLADAGGGLTTPNAEKLRSAMATGALLYDREDMRYLGPEEVPAGLIWTFSPEMLRSYATMPAHKPNFDSHMMPYAQYGVMRTGWEPDDRFLLVDYAHDGGPHTHCDQLQVLLYSTGRDLLLDPGTCGYHEEDRPYYISREAHNILLIDGEGVHRRANPDVVSWATNASADFASGTVKNSNYMQQRSVLFVKPDYWVVVDHVSGDGDASPTVTRLFHLPPVDVKQTAHSVRTTFADGDNLWLHAADRTPLSMREGLLSADADGNKNVSSPVAAFEGPATLPAALCTLLVPFGDEKDIPTVDRLAGSDNEIIALRVAFPDGRTDWIAMAPTERELVAGKRSGKGMALCVRTDKDVQETAFELFGVTPLLKGAGE